VNRRALLGCAVLAAAAACTYAGPARRYEPRGIQTVAVPASGQDVFARDCAWCHGNAGQGTRYGPSLLGDRDGGAITDFMLRTGRMPLQDPAQLARRHPPTYPPALIKQIVAYVSTLGGPGPGVPAVDALSGDVRHGEELYQTNCASCHSVTGVGGTLTQGSPPGVRGGVASRSDVVIPGLKAATSLDVAEAMRTGPGAMPVFDDKTFPDPDVDSIARYVQYLRHPDNRGGLDLGGIGPVAEGFVAWVFGLGVILLLARRIGRSVRDDG